MLLPVSAQLTMVNARTLRQGSTLYVLTITSVTIMPFQLMTGWRGTRVTTLSRCCSRTTAEPLLTMTLLLLLKTIRTAASNTRTRTHVVWDGPRAALLVLKLCGDRRFGMNFDHDTWGMRAPGYAGTHPMGTCVRF